MQKAVFSIINYQFDKVSIDLENHTSNDLSLGFETKGIYNNADKSFDNFSANNRQRCKGELTTTSQFF